VCYLVLKLLEAEEVNLIIDKIHEHIKFINDEIIPFEEFVKAMRLVRYIDTDDVTFIALTNYMDETL